MTDKSSRLGSGGNDALMLSLPELSRETGVPMPAILRLSRESPDQVPGIGAGSQKSFPRGVIPVIRNLYALEREGDGDAGERRDGLLSISRARRDRQETEARSSGAGKEDGEPAGAEAETGMGDETAPAEVAGVGRGTGHEPSGEEQEPSGERQRGEGAEKQAVVEPAHGAGAAVEEGAEGAAVLGKRLDRLEARGARMEALLEEAFEAAEERRRRALEEAREAVEEEEAALTIEQDLAERLGRVEERTQRMADQVARAVEELRRPREGEAEAG